MNLFKLQIGRFLPSASFCLCTNEDVFFVHFHIPPPPPPPFQQTIRKSRKYTQTRVDNNINNKGARMQRGASEIYPFTRALPRIRSDLKIICVRRLLAKNRSSKFLLYHLSMSHTFLTNSLAHQRYPQNIKSSYSIQRIQRSFGTWGTCLTYKSIPIIA